MFWNLWIAEEIAIVKRPMLWFCLGLLAAILIFDLAGAYSSANAQYSSVPISFIGGGQSKEMSSEERAKLAHEQAVEKATWPVTLIRNLDQLRVYNWLVVLVIVSSIIAQEYTWRNPQLLLSRGVSRFAYIASRFVSHLGLLMLIVHVPVLVATLVSGITTMLLLGKLDLQTVNFSQLAASTFMTAYCLLPYAALAMFLAILSRYFILPLAAGIGFVIGENLMFNSGIEFSKFLPFLLGTRLTEIYQEIAVKEVHINYVQVAAQLPVKLLPFNQAATGIALWSAVLLGLTLIVSLRQDLPE